ncbi:methionyl-tRNA formyltransferase [Desulfogranum japonicum]|uniref:methionyl-tRNA formyltransferase n=1 Tax=Desulfogranum japonicum TaxID=231447 RepID=UPI00041FB7CF|nr:methionyl-tRNA formyltransferase [Desulfogranum japonicum]
MTAPLRIVFMGTPDFAVPSLQALLDSPDDVIGVVCQPDRKKGRGRKLMPPPVKQLAEAAGLPIFQPESIKTDEFFTTIEQLNPDLMVVVAYGKILPSRVLRYPRLGTINVHGSLLPKYRGAAPIQWAVMNGDPETGVTIMQMDEGMDTGDILYPVKLPVTREDTAGTMFDKLSELGGKALATAIEQLKQGNLTPVPQDEAQASHAPMLKKEQGHLDWSLQAETLHSLIRGLDPWPSAYGFLNDKRFRFFSPEVVNKQATEPPGTIALADSSGLLIATATDYLRIREIQPEGKKRMPVQDCLNGLRITPGDQFV